jgi:hypothetical protein
VISQVGVRSAASLVPRPRLALAALLVLAAALLAGPVVAQEPVDLTGAWVGMWWMGKYEEPIELDLTQATARLTGRVTLSAYPTSGATSAVAVVRATVTGAIEGHRVELTWTMPEERQFRAELTVLSPGTLFGVGGVEGITTGFELRRAR